MAQVTPVGLPSNEPGSEDAPVRTPRTLEKLKNGPQPPPLSPVPPSPSTGAPATASPRDQNAAPATVIMPLGKGSVRGSFIGSVVNSLKKQKKMNKCSIVGQPDDEAVRVLRVDGVFADIITFDPDYNLFLKWCKGAEDSQGNLLSLGSKVMLLQPVLALIGLLSVMEILPSGLCALCLFGLAYPTIQLLTSNITMERSLNKAFEANFILVMVLGWTVGFIVCLQDIRALFPLSLFVSFYSALHMDSSHMALANMRRFHYTYHWILSLVIYFVSLRPGIYPNITRHVMDLSLDESMPIRVEMLDFSRNSMLTVAIFFTRYVLTVWLTPESMCIVRARLRMNTVTFGQIREYILDAPSPDRLNALGQTQLPNTTTRAPSAVKTARESARGNDAAAPDHVAAPVDGKVHPAPPSVSPGPEDSKPAKKKSSRGKPVKARGSGSRTSKASVSRAITRQVTTHGLRDDQILYIMCVGERYRDLQLIDCRDSVFAHFFGDKVANTIFRIQRIIKWTPVTMILWLNGVIIGFLAVWGVVDPSACWIVLPGLGFVGSWLGFCNKYLIINLMQSFELPYLMIMFCITTYFFSYVFKDERMVFVLYLAVCFIVALTGDSAHPGAARYRTAAFSIAIIICLAILSTCAFGLCVNTSNETVNWSSLPLLEFYVGAYTFTNRTIMVIIIFFGRFLYASYSKAGSFAVLKCQVRRRQMTVLELRDYLNSGAKEDSLPNFGWYNEGDNERSPPPEGFPRPRAM